MKAGDIQTWRSMDAGGDPDTAGWRLERWLEEVCAHLRPVNQPRRPPGLEIERRCIEPDGHMILVWRAARLIAAGYIVRTSFNSAMAVGTVIEDLIPPCGACCQSMQILDIGCPPDGCDRDSGILSDAIIAHARRP